MKTENDICMLQAKYLWETNAPMIVYQTPNRIQMRTFA